ncbi:MAG TPA: dephospho-CoA kinase [Dokdonella sp.]|uniref:dephospho-CoA kinase n=1 Tax=Dokdonella sp. TaxID=2291710 RepID=UPI002C0E8C37|nr:dephospho-CoA kinase [Dokdonella sp.]HUD43198.1 dephospho-CoA kinase [Dokdonella sp.]
MDTSPSDPLLVALTGGIASGKSTVADRFAALGVPVLDADVVARELVEPPSTALEAIVGRFGTGVLQPDGRLDRRRLRERIFADPAERLALEAILHPAIRHTLRDRAIALPDAYGLIAIPLLNEASGYDWVDRVLVVDAPRAVQLERLVRRDGLSPALAESMLDAQLGRERRLALADDVIDNTGTPAELDAQVHRLHARYLELATGAHRA